MDSTSRGVNRSVELSGISLAKDASVCLTRVASGSSGTVVNVGDALYFHFNWGGSPYDRGDSLFIMHGGTYLRREIDSVDYVNNRVILTASATVSAGDSLYVGATYNTATGSYSNRLSGARPDIGPYEIASSDGGGTTIPGQVTNVSPAEGSTQAQPVVFRWRAVSGATSYWLTASYDNWGHDHVNVQISDTSYAYSGFPVDTTVIWNVAAGNSAGWGAWSDVWRFSTQASVSYPDTLVVNWNNVIESSVLSGNTAVVMANLARRDNILVVRNPSGRLIDWPTGIAWPGRATEPQPAAGDTVAYWLVRDGGIVYGFELGSQSASSGGVTAGWVNAQLASYLKFTNPLTPPTSSTDTGTAGEFRYDAGYIYFCHSTNSWIRWTVSSSW